MKFIVVYKSTIKSVIVSTVFSSSVVGKQAKLGTPSPARYLRRSQLFLSFSAPSQLQFPQVWYSDTMEEEDDDFYDPTDVVPPTQAQNNTQNPPSNGHETGDAEEEEIEVEDDEVC